MNVKWIFDDGLSKLECSTFPYAYRTLFNMVKKFPDAAKRVRIISPTKKVYNYKMANDLALAQGLLTTEGTINSKEFKKSYR